MHWGSYFPWVTANIMAASITSGSARWPSQSWRLWPPTVPSRAAKARCPASPAQVRARAPPLHWPASPPVKPCVSCAWFCSHITRFTLIITCTPTHTPCTNKIIMFLFVVFSFFCFLFLYRGRFCGELSNLIQLNPY